MKKIILAFLCASLLLPLSACGGGNEPAVTESGNAAVTTAEAAEEAEKDIFAGLPEADYEGYGFTVFDRGKNYMPQWYAIDIFSEAEDGDPVNDAVYSRNRTVEEKYNVAIREFASDSPVDDYTKTATAGDDAYDLLCLSVQRNLLQLLKNGLLASADKFPYLSLSESWWDGGAIESLKLMNTIYILEGDITIVDKYATWAVLFGKGLVENHGLASPYELVDSGKWTLDKMKEMAYAVSGDLDGNGVIDNNDTIGLLGEPDNLLFLLGGFGLPAAAAEKDSIVMQLDSPKYVDAFQKVLEFMCDDSVSFVSVRKRFGGASWEADYHPIFSGGRALFYVTGLNRFTMFRQDDFSFGVVPLPKYSEQQEKYICVIDPAAACGLAMPVTVSDPERASVIIEALCRASDVLQHAFYDITLTQKEVRDTESEKMLETIFSSRAFDVGVTYNFGGFITMTSGLIKDNKSDIVSAYETIRAKCEKDIGDLIAIANR